MDNKSADRRPPTSWPILRAGILLVALIALLYFGQDWFPAVRSGPGSPRTMCLNNIRNLGLASIEYAGGNNGQLPAAWNVDKQGRPLQSWRVSQIGYLDQPAIARAYHLDEPWNSPFNSQFANRDMRIMHCPEDVGKATDTSYMVVVGPRTAFPGSKPCLIKEIEAHDGLANTLTIVETSNSGVNWSEPREIKFDDAIRGINVPNIIGISSRHRGLVLACFADGHALPISDKTDPAVLKQLLQIDDGGPKNFP